MLCDSQAFLLPVGQVFGFAARDLTLDIGGFTVVPSWWHVSGATMANFVRLVHLLLRMQPVPLVPLTSREQLAHITPGSGTTHLLFGIQYPPEDGRLGPLVAQGVRATTIAYEGRNRFGSGFEFPQVGLTKAGRDFLDEVERHKVIIDLSHASHQTARDVLEHRITHSMSFAVMASHTGSYEEYEHPRNLPPEVLQGIGECEGYVGVYLLTFGLDEQDNTGRPFIRHLQQVLRALPRKRYEYGYVGIGSDGVYKKMTSRQHERQFKRMTRKTGKAFRPRNPIEPLAFNSPHKLPLLGDYLERTHLFSPHILKGIMGDDYAAFLARSLP